MEIFPGRQFLELNSTKFNTIPVIHSAITINNFGGELNMESGVIIFNIPVHSSYDGNSARLFKVRGEIGSVVVFNEIDGVSIHEWQIKEGGNK